jgi:tubulin beta
MVPFPRLHFFAAGYAPLVATSNRAYTASNVPELTNALFQRRSLLAAIDPAMGKYLTVSVAYRGKLSMRDIENSVYEYQSKNSEYFVPWIPNGALTTLCTVPPIGQVASATLVANTTAISEVFKRSHVQFRQLFRESTAPPEQCLRYQGVGHTLTGAYTCHFVAYNRYTGEGMDEMEFTEAEVSCCDPRKTGWFSVVCRGTGTIVPELPIFSPEI